MPNHCYFKERCDRCIEKCGGDYPCMVQVSPTHYVSCHLYGEEVKHD
jgi:peptide/nickel transport system ATP-binding protein